MHSHILALRARFKAVAQRRCHAAALKVFVDVEAVEIARRVDVAKADELSALVGYQSEVFRQRARPCLAVGMPVRPGVHLRAGVVPEANGMHGLIKQRQNGVQIAAFPGTYLHSILPACLFHIVTRARPRRKQKRRENTRRVVLIPLFAHKARQAWRMKKVNIALGPTSG